MRSVNAEPALARAAPPRTSRPSLFLLFLFLLALGILPVLGDRYVDAFRDDVRTLVEPARNLTTELHVALALGSASLRDYLNTGDVAFLNRYYAANAREQRAYLSLEPLAARLGPAVLTRYRELRAAELHWHNLVSELFRRYPRNPAAMRRALAGERAYQNTLNAAASLDEALALVATQRRQRIDRAERVIRLLSVALATLAAFAGLITLSLGKKLQRYALATEQARKELEAVLASRARLARSITHDLKNPLNAIMGNLQLIEKQEDGLSPELGQRIRRAEHSATSMISMIDSLLELERAKSGTLQLQPERVDLRRLVIDVAEEHRDAIEGAGLELQVDVPKNLDPIETDPARVTRVLGNLLSNAAKYTETGAVRVRVASTRNGERGPGRWIGVTVQDSGRGIPETDLEHIFEEFSRLDAPGTTGVGLGLAVSRRLARLLGGDITVTSQLGQGSAFTFWLPQRRAAAA